VVGQCVPFTIFWHKWKKVKQEIGSRTLSAGCNCHLSFFVMRLYTVISRIWSFEIQISYFFVIFWEILLSNFSIFIFSWFFEIFFYHKNKFWGKKNVYSNLKGLPSEQANSQSPAESVLLIRNVLFATWSADLTCRLSSFIIFKIFLVFGRSCKLLICKFILAGFKLSKVSYWCKWSSST